MSFGTGTGGTGTYNISSPCTAGGSITMTSGWVANIFAGRKVKFLGAGGQSQEATITANTTNTLTISTVATAPVTLATSYAIVQPAILGVGIALNWLYGNSDVNTRGKYMIIPRGGATSGFNKLDLTTDQWNLMTTSAISEVLGSGTMCAYDGLDRLYFTKDVTQRVYYLDVNTGIIHGAGIYPQAAGTVIIGNRMEVLITADGLKYLWLNRHSQLDCFRAYLIQ
jgi:hypothetical protein